MSLPVVDPRARRARVVDPRVVSRGRRSIDRSFARARVRACASRASSTPSPSSRTAAATSTAVLTRRLNTRAVDLDPGVSRA